MMDGSDGSQDLGATFLTSDSQLFVQSDGDGNQQFKVHSNYMKDHSFVMLFSIL